MALADQRSTGVAERRTEVREQADASGIAEPNGGIAAAVLAAGIACAAFGVLVVLAEVSTPIHDALTVSEGAGPLSGKGLGATAIWVVAWAVLHPILRNRELPWRPVARATTALIAVGLIATFPPVFQLFAH